MFQIIPDFHASFGGVIPFPPHLQQLMGIVFVLKVESCNYRHTTPTEPGLWLNPHVRPSPFSSLRR